MSVFNFDLTFDLENKKPDQAVNDLIRYGFNDAIFGIGKNGKIRIKFARNGRSEEVEREKLIKEISQILSFKT